MDILTKLFSNQANLLMLFQRNTASNGCYRKKGPGRKRDFLMSERTENNKEGHLHGKSKLARKFMRKVATKKNF